MDWDEELKRQAAISALLAPPDQPLDTQTDEQVVVQPDDKTDYHRLVNSSFEATDDHPNISPPPPLNLPTPTPESPTGPADVKTDEDTGTRYVQDPLEGKIPHAELATAADKEAFKPSDVTLPQVTAVGTGAEVPVRRGEELAEPWHPAAQTLQVPTPTPESPAGPVPPPPKPVPGIISGSQNAILNPAAGVTPPTPAPKYPAQIVTPEEASGKTSVVNAPAQPAAAAVVQPDSTKSWDQLVNTAWPSAEKPAVAAGVQPDTTGVDNTGVANYFSKNGEAPIVDSNDARLTTVNVGDQKWQVHQNAAPYFQGFLSELAQQGAPITSAGGWNNRVIAGTNKLSQHAYGGAIDVSQEGRDQVSPAFQKWIQDNPNALQTAEQHWHIYGGERFGDLGHFEWGGVGGEAGKDAGPQEPPINTLVKLDQSGLNVTHFGYEKPGEAGWDKDSAKGNGKYVENLIPGYDVALNSASAALVGNPKPGETFQYAGREWRYGDAVSEKLKDPRFDIFDPAGTALAGGMPVGRQIAGTTTAATAGPQSLDDITKNWVKLSPADQANTETASSTKAQGILNDLQTKSPNLPAYMNALQNPIPGVPEYMRKQVVDKTKADLTKYAQDYYQEKDPTKAFDRIMSAPNVGTFGGEVLSKLGPNFQHAWLALAGQATSASPLMQFINVAQPDASPEARTNLVKQVMAQSGDDRTHFIKALYSHLNPDQAQNVDLNQLLNWSDTVSQPGVQAEQARQQDYIKSAVAQNRKDLREDPTMEHTYGGTIANAIAQFPKNVTEGLLPVIGQSAMFSEIYTDTLEGLRNEHPTWTEDQLKAKAAASSIPQDMLQELINVGTLGLGGGALRSVENPIARIATSSILHGTLNLGAGSTQQVVSNITTGRPIGEGVLEAGVSAGIQGLIGGAVGGRHGEVAEPVRTEEPVHAEEPAAPVTPPPRPVTTNEVLGPDVAEPPTPPRPWYLQGAEPGQDPLVIRGAERSTWTPQELSDAVQRIPNGTPEELRSVLESMQSPTSLHLEQGPRELRGGETGESEIGKARLTQAGIDTQVESKLPLPPAPRPGNIGEAEPWVSREANKSTLNGVANKYQELRTAAGELPPIDPNVGVSTEELLARGVRMSPEEINQHVNNLMNGQVSNPRDMAAAVRAKERELTQRSRQLGVQSEENPSNAPLKQEADAALKTLGDFHSLGGPVQKMKEIFNHMGVGLQGDMQHDLSTENGLKEKFFKEKGKAPPPGADPVIRDTAKRVRQAHSVEYTAKSKLSSEVDKWTRGKMTDEKIEAMRQWALKEMNKVAC